MGRASPASAFFRSTTKQVAALTALLEAVDTLEIGGIPRHKRQLGDGRAATSARPVPLEHLPIAAVGVLTRRVATRLGVAVAALQSLGTSWLER